ncbi:MAG: GTPase HflX [Acidobacteriota bacterium]
MSPELARHLAAVSRDLGRQVGVLITREGSIRNVMVGDAFQLQLPDVGRLRGGGRRFRGLRLVHTHLRGEGLSEDDLNDLALLRLDMVAMIEALPEGDAGRLEVAHLSAAPPAEEAAWEDSFHRIEAPDVHRLELDADATMRALEEELARTADDAALVGREAALVVGLDPDDDRFAETLELVRSAGVAVSGITRQRRRKLHPRTVVGRGKLREIVLQGMRQGAEVAIFDVDLQPAQARAFEEATGLRSVDRTQLILDIFAQRARSSDGKLQVELAQLKYSLPRLSGSEAGRSRQVGGIGGRGPGETVLEVSRRRIRDRIGALEKRVAALARQRDLRRQRRRRQRLPVLSIIGYTNAGKSTLLNALTDSRIQAADQLFVTLDPTSRRLRFPREGEVIVTDTVGFLSDLPKDLVAAFHATLEELAEADLLLHVADAADPRLDDKLAAVEGLVEELGLGEVERLVVLNQCDRLPRETAAALAHRYRGVAISALERQGLRELLTEAEERIGRRWKSLEEWSRTTHSKVET